MITAGITKRHAKRNFLTSMTIVLLTASTNTNVRLVFVKTATNQPQERKKSSAVTARDSELSGSPY